MPYSSGVRVFISDFLVLIYLGSQKSILKTPLSNSYSTVSSDSGRCLELSLIGLSTLTGKAHKSVFDLDWN